MGAALGDLLQLVDNQVYLEQQVLNVYYYRITNVTGIADPYLPALNDWFTDNVLDPVKALQVNGLQHVSREWKNLTNGVDLFVDGTVVDGGQSVSPSLYMPSYVSLGFILRRESLVTRNGYKRIAGIGEGLISGNEFIGTGSGIPDIEEAFAKDIVLGLVTIAEPIILKRPIVVPVESYEYSSIGSASFRGVGTQNSRKKGRGI